MKKQLFSFGIVVTLAIPVLGKSLVFTGDRSEGVVSSVESCDSFTFTAWIKPGNSKPGNPYPRIVQIGSFYLHLVDNTALTGYALCIGMSGLKQKGPAGTADISLWHPDATLPKDKWTHVALFVKPSDKCTPTVYLNGRRYAVAGGDQFLPSPFPGGKCTVGNVAVGGARPFNGMIADAEFRPGALPEAALRKLAACDPDGCVSAARLPTDKELAKDLLPVVDISGETSRQVVIAPGTEETYQGHPTTVVADDGTIFCVWTIRHGGHCGPMARSTDGGKTWTRCDEIMPPEYAAKHVNCPTLQRIPRKDGGTNLAVFSCTEGGCGIVISEDDGKTWKTAPVADLSAGMPPTGLVPLKDGSSALFGQFRKDPKEKGDGPCADQGIWMSVSKDGGWTWSAPRTVAVADNENLCEPFCLRSPDGKELCLLMRENRHDGCSMMCFSRDEGKTWTKPVETCWGLSGDRHEGVYLPDGRLFIAFRDRAIGASTYGQYVAWVGSYDDLRRARPGDFRIRLLAHLGKGGFKSCDTGYSGVEVLKDGTIVCTTYMKYWPDARLHSVVSTRFKMSEVTKKLKR